uniref:Uncharacterized protein n=1 Tax=Steinernema glaseri TaxID=37863 RepID=A0A1I7ZVB0_9BILA
MGTAAELGYGKKGALNEEGVTPRRRGETSLNDEKAGFRMEHGELFTILIHKASPSVLVLLPVLPLFHCVVRSVMVLWSRARGLGLCPALMDSVRLSRIIS